MVGKPPRNTPIGREASNEENASGGHPGRGTCPARAACRMVKTSKVRYCLVGGSLLGAVRGAHFYGMVHRYPRPDCDGLVTCLAVIPNANCSTSLTATYGIARRLVSPRTRFVENGLTMPSAWACSRMLFSSTASSQVSERRVRFPGRGGPLGRLPAEDAGGLDRANKERSEERERELHERNRQ